MARTYVPAVLLAALAAAQTIVVAVPGPDLYLREAFPQAKVVLLAKGDPHDYQLTPEDLALLRSLAPSDAVVLTMHVPFEHRIAQMAERGEIRAKVVDISKVITYLTWDGQEVHGDGQPLALNPHDEGLYPPNAIRVVEEVARRTGLAPDLHFLDRLKALNTTYAGRASGRAIALTPTAQYILHWLGYSDVAVLLRDPEAGPTAEDLQRALQYAAQGAPALAVAPPGQSLAIADQFAAKAREAGIEPKVVAKAVAGDYVTSMEEIAKAILQLPTTAATPQAAQQDTATAAAAGAAVAATATAAATAVLLSKRRNRRPHPVAPF